MTEYNTDVNTLSLSADYQATDKLEMNASLNYSDAQADWKGLSIETPGVVNDPVMTNLYDVSAVNIITTYSDLHYVQTDVTLGGTYQFTPAFFVAAQAGWQKFEDKDPYVYGDQDGEAWRGNFGVGYKF